MRHRLAVHAIVVPCLAALVACTGARTSTSQTLERTTMQHATGAFDVTVTPRAGADPAAPVGVMALDKTYHGPLDATAVGEMLASRTEGTGSAVYVALERVTGTLDGRRGTFVLAHRGTMTKDGQELVIIVAPASGTGDLAGISGTMGIRIEGKAHFYDLAYSLP